jgi:hypothetical protein
LFEYCPAAGFAQLGGEMAKGEKYVRAIAYDERAHQLYVGIGSHARLVRYDITTGISIQFPSNWEKSVNLDNFITFRAPPETDTRIYPAAFGLKIQELASKSVLLQEITKVQISELKKSNPKLEFSESTSTTLAGKPAYRVVFTATDNNQVERKAMQIWTIIDNKAILITYKAQPDKYSTYLPTIERMIGSFKAKSMEN